MKLKRILSLALSGVLAVSMLTACGGGSIDSIFRPGDKSAAFADALNDAQTMLEYDSNDGKLKTAIADVVRSVSKDDVKNGIDQSDISAAVRVKTGYEDLWLDDAWKAVTESTHSVKVFIYDASTFTMSEVANDVAEKLSVMGLDKDAAKENATHTNSYEGDVAARAVTISAANSGEKDTEAWVVAVAIEQTATKTSST